MAKNSSPESKASIISAVSDWLKLLALIIVVADGLLAVAYYSTKDSDPFRKYYFPLMIGLFALIVVGVFLDRLLSSRAPHSQITAPGGVRPRQVALVTRWYFKSGITEEELDLTIVGNTVTGMRTTRHPKGKETPYAVTGWHHTSTFWLEYHDILDQYGGGHPSG